MNREDWIRVTARFNKEDTWEKFCVAVLHHVSNNQDAFSHALAWRSVSCPGLWLVEISVRLFKFTDLRTFAKESGAFACEITRNVSQNR